MPPDPRRSAPKWLWLSASAIAAALLSGAVPARAEPPPRAWTGPESRLDALLERLKTNPLGSFYLKLRPRYEYAQTESQKSSNALTLRAVFGLGSRTWKGFSFLVEGEGIAAASTDWYFDGTGTPNGRSLIPDPPDIDLNQGYLHYEVAEWTTHLRGGRQRIVLDDARFVGDVIWRQNQQTYDAVRLTSGFGRRDLRLTYAFLGQILRVSGNQGPAELRDFDSSSHLVNLHWSGLPRLGLTAFSYLLDLDDSPADSSNSYGLRAKGGLELDERWGLDYTLSYAFQTDAADNPDDYQAHYAWLEGGLVYQPLGKLAVGFELLGSDDGTARFRTPLATAHAFNGWADAFLDNGGDDGLRDLFVRLLPRLPWQVEGEVAFHQFWADEGGDELGWEIDAYFSRPISRFATLLVKSAYFDRTTTRDVRPRVFRAWVQLSFEF